MFRAGRVAALGGLFLLSSLMVNPLVLHAEILFPQTDHKQSISITADHATRWNENQQEVWLLSGSVSLNQGKTSATAKQAVVWIRPGTAAEKYRAQLAVYLEGKVSVSQKKSKTEKTATSSISAPTWFANFESTQQPQISIRSNRTSQPPTTTPAIYRRAFDRRTNTGSVKKVQFVTGQSNGAPSNTDTNLQPEVVDAGTGSAIRLPAGVRQIQLFPRSSERVQAQGFPSQTRDEYIAIINSGVNILISGEVQGGTIDISTDRIVIWTKGINSAGISGLTMQDSKTPLEIYLEGNIVFRQGDKIIHAERMYYNVNQNQGIILDAHLRMGLEFNDKQSAIKAPVGEVRVRAGVIRQLDSENFLAQDAAVSTSRLGVPSYWLQSQSISLHASRRTLYDPISGQPLINPTTGEVESEPDRMVNANQNYTYVEGIPVFYWPSFTSDLEDPTLYLERISIKMDRIFGNQIYTDWNAYQLLGMEKIRGTKWGASLDYLSDRGPAGGTNFSYELDHVWKIPGHTVGFFDAWGIHDKGLDDLGSDRRMLIPEEENRARIFWQHRQNLANGYRLTAELGYLTDRNFLEQYFENEWDQNKDQTTGFEFKRVIENRSWSITGDFRLNDFFTQTEWLPRGDHFWLGQSVLGDHLTWFEHSSVGYARLRVADAPPPGSVDAAKFDLLPWESAQNGERVVTRQEIDLPVSLGPARFVPYALGELGHWGSDVMGDDVQRAYGQLGVRASMAMWSVNPDVHLPILNVNGLAHKVMFNADFSYTDSNRDLSRFPLYDQIDDDNIEHFRRRFKFNTFGLPAGMDVPPMFEERMFALRSGFADLVTSPSSEIVDDQMAIRFGATQRWQTKRGPAGNQHILDWIVLDTRAVWFPKEERDNFGEDIGLAEFDFRWHVGDRVTVLSDGVYDFFDDGQRMYTIGAMLTRPPRGNIYAGFRSLEGPISSNIILTSFNYRMSPKWVMTMGTSFDVGERGNIGQSFYITRVGESMIFRLGLNVDHSKNNVGFTVALEPRFLPKGRLGNLGGVQIAPAGSFGLE